MKSAFTLIELLIVVAIIGILAAIAVPNLQDASGRAKFARVLSDMKAIAFALDQYQMDHNAFPPDSSRPGVAIENYPWKQEGRVELLLLTSPVSYLSTVPGDLFHHTEYQYGAGNQDAFSYAADKGLWGEGPIAHTMKRAGVRWGIFSCGPDRILNMDEFRANPSLLQEEDVSKITSKPQWVIYNPSNGIRARGDIHWLEGYGLMD